MQMGLHRESMYHIGMNREAIKEAVLQKVAIGQQYRLKSVSATSNEGGKEVRCRLTHFSQNVAVFLHKNGTSESFTYQDLWMQMMDGTMA